MDEFEARVATWDASMQATKSWFEDYVSLYLCHGSTPCHIIGHSFPLITSPYPFPSPLNSHVCSMIIIQLFHGTRIWRKTLNHWSPLNPVLGRLMKDGTCLVCTSLPPAILTRRSSTCSVRYMQVREERDKWEWVGGWMVVSDRSGMRQLWKEASQE